MHVKMNRPVFPVRVSLVIISILLFGFVGFMQAMYQVDLSELFKWLVGVIGVTVLGDTWRPSGYAVRTVPADSPAVNVESVQVNPPPQV